eukprot:CAMPEP_0172648012 /NCGR_PEP_ID=MMETSP1068-20121228/241048_1 /TAXON_ID=35684 /ORGANISM="Pseudopedinella elastica, Strain CCMP716" /LENGTH=95 /DNA_ID=CAMNT_0013462311 /DNA_START=1415 /DNA_END=1703 /DNA_ORIENTATION=+
MSSKGDPEPTGDFEDGEEEAQRPRVGGGGIAQAGHPALQRSQPRDLSEMPHGCQEHERVVPFTRCEGVRYFAAEIRMRLIFVHKDPMLVKVTAMG